jgi:Cys-tRNA(Pro) deacylase
MTENPCTWKPENGSGKGLIEIWKGDPLPKDKSPVTNAIRMLREHQADFVLRPYNYEEKGGTAVSARELGVDEHLVIKTLVMEDENRNPLIILMHGDKQVSTKSLARVLGVKSIHPCEPATAKKHTGYMVGGTSPFGTRKPLPIYAERTILDLPKIYINAGKRGLLAEMAPSELVRILKPVVVEVGM